MRNEQVEKVVEFLRENVQCYPQVSDDEPGGYYTEIDQRMDEAADLLERLQSRIEALEKDAARYRWLTAQAWFQNAFDRFDPDDGGMQNRFETECARIIDTAMQSEKGGVV